MNLPGPALQEESQLWEEEVTVTMLGSGGDCPVAMGAQGGRHQSIVKAKLRADLTASLGDELCEHTWAKSNLFSEASERQTSALGIERIEGVFLLEVEGGMKTSWMKRV